MAVFAINPSCSHSQEFEMTRFKFMSLWMLLLVIAARGITAFSQAPAPNPACYMKAGPPSGLRHVQAQCLLLVHPHPLRTRLCRRGVHDGTAGG